MKIQSFNPTPNLTRSQPLVPSNNLPQDSFQASFKPEDLIPNQKFTQDKQGNGGRMALQMAGIGVMFGGILASTNLPGGWVGVGIIGSMCAGLALISLANR